MGINISGGVVAANGSKGGIYGKGTISGGEVTATGLNGLYTRGDTFNITGGEITLIGTNGGVYSEYDGAALNISDGAVVYIEGGISDFSSTYDDSCIITISGEDTIVLTKDSTGVIDSEFHMTLNDSIAFTNDTTQINNTLLNTFGNSSPYSNAGGLYYAGNVEFVTYNIGAHGSTNDVTYESVETNGSPNAVPDVIADDGYVLIGWYKDSDTTLITDLSTQIITANTLFTAQYDFLYTVNYAEGSYGSIADNEESEDVINNNSPQNVPTATPNSGYTFAGWYKDSDTTLLSSLDISNEVITAHTTFSAQYDDINVTNIELASETLTLIIGDTDTLGYVISPSDALNQDVTWSSSNTTVATVDNLGNITALAVGNSLITVYTVDGGIFDTCTLEVIRQPDSPQNLTATEDNEQLTLNWTAPSFDGGSAITEYEVSSDNGITWVMASSDTAHTFTGLTNGTEYICSVRAVNIAGSGAEASIAATPRTVPSMPLNFTVTEGDEQVTFNWTSPSDDGGSAITGYEVSSDNGITWVNASSDTSHTFTILTNGTEYICSVRAVNEAGYGAEASIAATPRTVPGMPLNFTVAEDNEQLTLTWTAPSFDGGSAITEYEVSSDNGITWVIASSDTAHTFTGLTNGTEYICSVRAVNIAGSGAEASIAATPRTVPSMPLNFTVTEGDEQLTFNWTSPSDDGGSAITGYEVSSDNGITWVNASSDTAHTFTGLTNGTEYICSVRAVNEAGYGAEASIEATPRTVPSMPLNFTVAEDNEQLTLNWTSPSDDGGSAITGYEVSSDNGITWVNAASDTSHTFTILTNGTEYICSIRAVNEAGYGAEASIAATPRTVPSMPLNFTVAEDDEQLTFNWTSPSDDGGSAITGYEVSSDNGITWVNASSDISHTFTILTNGTEYICSVRAVNEAGYGAEASIAATPRTVPSMPLNFTVAEDNEQLTLTWTAPSFDGGSAITEYEVSSDNGITWVMASSDTAHTFTGLTNGVDYYCSVRAVNIAGIGEVAGSILGKPYETRVVDTVDIINMRNPKASVITIEGDDLLLASLVEFSVNGKAILLDTANTSRYTFDGGYIEQGSIVIIMTPDYINSLPMGANYITLSLNNEGLFIYKEFNVVNQAIEVNVENQAINPQTGDDSINMWIYLFIPLLSALAIVLANKIRKKYLAG